MAYMQQRYFKQIWRCDVHVTTHTFLLPLFCKWTSYFSHSDCLVVILKFYTVSCFGRQQKVCKLDNIFKQTRVNFFDRENIT